MITPRVIALAACVCAAAVTAAPATGDTAPPLPAPLSALPGAPLPSLTSSSSSSGSASATPERGRTASVAVALDAARSITIEVNRIRRLHKLRPLRVSAQLTRAGVEHAKALALAGLFTHAWSDGSPFPTWMRRFYPPTGYRRWSTGENLVWQSPDLTARRAVQLWLASPPHRRNLLRPTWREIGLGVVRAQAAPGAYGNSDVELAAAEFGVRSR
jgi:uncharacterized protein YkwD